ncbi:stage V sporulation protein AD [Heliorestis acidaminivorans]|uniref:Stage V sporulation protein AD n=1 Tax=Heliorestis acidaminivorans TaxID=553427 RepID=A0A6I0EX49_9FIRM|nr:stage V sporulation protein AD [Heliorestis acidaminivorans]
MSSGGTYKKRGKQTLSFTTTPYIASSYTVVGSKENEGPLQGSFHHVLQDNIWGESSWEKTEAKMMAFAVEEAIKLASWSQVEVDFFLAGDLLNQNITADYTARKVGIPFFGLFGACSTMAEGLILASILIDGAFAHRVVAAASSHHETAERQFRFPTELGVQRPMSAQWTVTGAGAVALASPEGICNQETHSDSSRQVRITHATIGKVIDLGVRDAADMGSAMAPAVTHTILRHLQDLNRRAEDYDLIVSGDLGLVGHKMSQQLLREEGVDLGPKYSDCGIMIFDPKKQDTHAGGSGCGCSATVVLGPLLKMMKEGLYDRILFVGSGALFSPTSFQQGESIPGIGHAVVLEA